MDLWEKPRVSIAPFAPVRRQFAFVGVFRWPVLDVGVGGGRRENVVSASMYRVKDSVVFL